jgi:hypothetical protein
MQQNNLMRWIEAADEREFVLVRKMVTPAGSPDPSDAPPIETVGSEIRGLLRRCCELAHLR